MKTHIKPKQLFRDHFMARALRFDWAGLALWLGLLNLALAADPDFTRQPTNLSVSLGATATFRVYVSGTSPFVYQWHYTNSGNSFPLDGIANPSALRNILNLTNVQSSDAGGYFIVVTNEVGSATSQVATLTVDPTFIKITEGAIVTDREASASASWCDYDGDGFQDLFVANFYDNGGSASKNSLYHNNGDGTFTKITTNALSATAGWWIGGHWADVDNDGKPDLYVAGADSGRQSVFYRNDGNGRFTAVSIVPTRDAASRDSMYVSWGDYDNDGWVDLFIPAFSSLPNNHLFRNLGDLNFQSMRVAEVGDLVAPEAHESSPMVMWIDYDNDGYLDIYIWQNHFALYLNSGNGFFTQTYEGSIANAFDEGGRIPSWADYDNDGYLDLFLSRPGSSNTLHRNLGGTNSVEVTQAGLDRPMNTIGSSWGDYDNDGNLDLFVVNNPSWMSPLMRSANMLYRNNGDGTFAEVDVGSPIWEGNDDLAPSWIDYDNDGFLDLFITAGQILGPEMNYLYRNNVRATGNTNHWLKVSLVGKASNGSGIGAKVRVTANIRGKSVTQLRSIESPGYNGSNQGLLAHFGLGDATKVDTLRIEWPSGIVQEWKDVAVDQHLTKVESQNPPPPQPQITASGCAADGAFQATVTCAATNFLCVLEASTNLAQWTKLSVRTNTTGTMQFNDPGATNRPERFYRAVVP